MSAIPRKQFISSETVVAALQTLATHPFKRSGRTALMGYLLLKAKGVESEIYSSGPQSVEPELSRFFRIAPGTPFPDVNPFGQRQGAVEFLATGYERRGTYTHLYQGRTLERLLKVSPVAGHFCVGIPNDTSQKIATLIGDRAPLLATAAFLLRKEDFDEDARESDVIERFKEVFSFSDRDLDTVFNRDLTLQIEFSSDQFDNCLASLPPELQPHSPNMSHATKARAATELVQVTHTGDYELEISEDTRRRVQRAMATSKAVGLVGLPGTAKSRLWTDVFNAATNDPSLIGLENPPNYVCHTADIDWTSRTIIGGYYPQSDGHLLQAIRNNQICWFDEMNRADLDRILGPILTFLGGQSVDLGPTHLGGVEQDGEPKPMILMWANSEESGVTEDEQQRVY